MWERTLRGWFDAVCLSRSLTATLGFWIYQLISQQEKRLPSKKVIWSSAAGHWCNTYSALHLPHCHCFTKQITDIVRSGLWDIFRKCFNLVHFIKNTTEMYYTRNSPKSQMWLFQFSLKHFPFARKKKQTKQRWQEPPPSANYIITNCKGQVQQLGQHLFALQ